MAGIDNNNRTQTVSNPEENNMNNPQQQTGDNGQENTLEPKKDGFFKRLKGKVVSWYETPKSPKERFKTMGKIALGAGAIAGAFVVGAKLQADADQQLIEDTTVDDTPIDEETDYAEEIYEDSTVEDVPEEVEYEVE